MKGTGKFPPILGRSGGTGQDLLKQRDGFTMRLHFLGQGQRVEGGMGKCLSEGQQVLSCRMFGCDLFPKFTGSGTGVKRVACVPEIETKVNRIKSIDAGQMFSITHVGRKLGS